MTPPLVEAAGLTKSYTTARGPIAAVDGIDLRVEAGEVLVIRGRSGSGKSTLLGMLGGLCRPSGGKVVVDEVDLGKLGTGPLAELRGRRFGFMFQFAGLLPTLRAIDNIALPALLAGMDDRLALERARELLGLVGLAQRWDAYAGELSGGQQRRVALARALINQPVVVLADEPTSDLDEQAEQEVLGLLHELRRTNNTTLIIVSHDPNLAGRADRVIHLRGGKIVATESHPLAIVGFNAKAARPAFCAIDEPTVPGPAFEPEPTTLAPSEPTPLGAGLSRFLLGFVGWALLFAVGLYAIDVAWARWQRTRIEAKNAGRKHAEELALQQLRADINEVRSRPDGSYELSVYLQNFKPDRPIHVLGPKLRLFVQVDRSWQPIAVTIAGGADDVVHTITEKQAFPLTFRADLDRYDELIGGYMHIRISSVMIVSDRSGPAPDLFERNDDYFIYLKPQALSEDEVRRRNNWQPGAIVPRWIAMPPH